MKKDILLKGIDTHVWKVTLIKNIFIFLVKWGLLKNKKFAPTQQFFPFRSGPFADKVPLTGKLTGSLKSCVPTKNDRESI